MRHIKDLVIDTDCYWLILIDADWYLLIDTHWYWLILIDDDTRLVIMVYSNVHAVYLILISSADIQYKM